jgi:ABC-type multidrug transport system permease subunit
MAKIDEVKEILNSLRVGLSIVVGIIVLLTGSLINKKQADIVDIFFWLGLLLDIVLLLIFLKIILSIKKHTKEIKEL